MSWLAKRRAGRGRRTSEESPDFRGAGSILYGCTLQTPWGCWKAVASRTGIRELRPGGSSALRSEAPVASVRAPSQVRRWFSRLESGLMRYLRTGRPAWPRLPLDLSTLRPFARSVARSTLKIPVGQVRSYGWLARRLRSAGAGRACGQALASNRLALLVPCHRVVRGDGEPGGYAWGRSWKRRLLALEARGRAS